MDKEIWKDVSGFKGLYEISNLGNLRNFRTKKVIKPFLNNEGYYIYNLWVKCRQHKFLLHRLVAKEFIPNPENKPEIDHIDGNRMNNTLSNLRWCTHKENSNYDIRKKRLSNSNSGKNHVRFGKFGKENPCSKEIASYKNGVLIKKYESYTEAEKDGYSRKGIYRNVRNITKNYKGYVWKELK